MSNPKNILHLTVGESMAASLARASATLQSVREGLPVPPYFGVGFDNVGEFFSVFTSKRWELIAVLRQGGAMSIAELARQLKRDYKNVHSDCERLIEWMAIEKDVNGLVYAPYDEILVDMKLPEKRAA